MLSQTIKITQRQTLLLLSFFFLSVSSLCTHSIPQSIFSFPCLHGADLCTLLMLRYMRHNCPRCLGRAHGAADEWSYSLPLCPPTFSLSLSYNTLYLHGIFINVCICIRQIFHHTEFGTTAICCLFQSVSLIAGSISLSLGACGW